MRSIAAMVLSLAALPGCATFEQAPKVTVTSVKLTDESVAGGIDSGKQSGEIHLEIANPNSSPLELDEVSYTVSLDGGGQFQAKRAALISLPSNGSMQMSLPFVAPRGLDGRQYSTQGSIRYVAPGNLAEILFDAGVRRPRVGFMGRGEVGAEPAPAS